MPGCESLTDWYVSKVVEDACRRPGTDRTTAIKQTLRQLGYDNPPGLTGIELAKWRFRKREKAGTASKITERPETKTDATFEAKLAQLVREHAALTRVSPTQKVSPEPKVTLIDWPPAGQLRITREAREMIYREISHRTARHHEPVETGGYLIADKTRYGLIVQATGPGDDSLHTPNMVRVRPQEAERIVERDRFRLQIVGRWHNHPTSLGYTPKDLARLSSTDIASRLASIRHGLGNIDLLVLQRYDGMVSDYRQGTILPWITTENTDGSWRCQRAKLEVFDT